MSHPLYVAFVWHQHQPLYKSRSAGEYRLPWVRLHGIKDYLDLVLLLAKYPKLHQTVNLVPSLILQLEDYISGKAFDPYLKLTLTPVEQLTLENKNFIVKHFFDANHRTLVAPHRRYEQLYQQTQEKGQKWCLEHWNNQDYADLLAWHNLAWFDPLFWDDPEIYRWLTQGKNFNLSDRQRIYSKQKEIMARIIPQHKLMQEQGQLEITTTPYTHPILPLLADSNVGRIAVSNMNLPKHQFKWAEDIPRHLQKSWDMYLDRFGTVPRGLWPSEQAISPEVLPYIAQQGFKWICSDEAVLGWTLKHFFHRDHRGNVYEPELLYRPYLLETPHGNLSIVFRDHRLSDLIGFTYSGMTPEVAAEDLINHLHSIADTLKQRQHSGSNSLELPWLVTIALDGENCWEHYELDGKPFLENLYQTLSEHSEIKLVTVAEYLEKYPATVPLPSERLHTGSWVDGNLTTWIGDSVKNKAWDLLTEARQTLAQHPEATPENNPEVWEALFAAEGSDWFWWFGEGHSSNQDAIFDQLFREHLTEIYQGLNLQIPANLKDYLEIHEAPGDHIPQGFIHPMIDGLGDEQDWNLAGKINVGGAMGTMHRSSDIQRLFYGVDHLNLYLRIDFKSGLRPGIDCPPEVHLLWFYPQKPMLISPAPLADIPPETPANYYFRHHLGINLLTRSMWFEQAGENCYWYSQPTSTKIALDKCLEIAIPWEDLHIDPDANLSLIVVLADRGKYHSYVPENGLINLGMP
jgi:alpha-amylase/alpha-mannosidase (GH57 family)